MLEVLGEEDERLERKGGYLEEGRIGHNKRDVHDDANEDEQGG